VHIIRHLKQSGAQGVVLCCAEISDLLRQEDYSIPMFDTTAIHAKAAVDFALSGCEDGR